jgi:Spy/CpxP family protein refolding chaperone
MRPLTALMSLAFLIGIVDACAAGSVKLWYVTYLDEAVGLTDEQKNAMNEIIHTRNKSMWNYQIQNAHQLKAAGNALVTAFRSMDGEAIARAQKGYHELHAPLHQLMRRSQNALMEILTTEQTSRLHEYQMVKAIEAIAAPVQLSDEQLRQIKAAWPKASDLEAGPTAYDQAVQRYLTPEQKAAIAKCRAMAFVKAAFGRAELTEDQLKQAELVAEELTKNPSIKSEEFHKTLSTRIEGLLTLEQKEAMKKPWAGIEGSPPVGGMPGAPPGSQVKAGQKKSSD